MNFFDIAVFSSGILVGMYLDQTYKLPNVKLIINNVLNVMKHYEPEKKSHMDVDV